MAKKGFYALYKGDELLALGTKKEIADQLGIKIKTVASYGTPSYRNRIKRDGIDGMLLIRVEEDADE